MVRKPSFLIFIVKTKNSVYSVSVSVLVQFSVARFLCLALGGNGLDFGGGGGQDGGFWGRRKLASRANGLGSACLGLGPLVSSLNKLILLP